MAFEEQNTLKYFASGIFQDIFIAIATLLIYLIIGVDYYDEVTSGDPQEGLVEFNLFTVLFIIFSLAVGSVVFYIIFTKLKGLGIRVVYSIVLSIPFLLLILEIFTLLYTTEVDILSQIVLYFLSLGLPIFGAVFLYVYGKGELRITIRNTGIILSSVIIGRTVAIYFDIAGIVFFAIILAIFDIYSVFRGPLAKIMGKPSKVDHGGSGNKIPSKKVMDRQFKQICEQGTPVLLSYQNTLLGVGDVLFFSILMYKALLEWSYIGFGVTFFMIIIGSSGTLFLLRKISPLPGLPLPVLTSLLGYTGLYFFL